MDIASKVLNQNSYQVMRLHYAEDLSIREIAKVMGKTETGIKVILFRSRQKLSKKAKSGGIYIMRKLLKILRNEPIDSSDKKLINALKNEAEIERLKEDENTEFDIVSITQVLPNNSPESSTLFKTLNKKKSTHLVLPSS